MARKFEVLPGGAPAERKTRGDVTAETMLRHFQSVNASILQDALDTWGNIWDQLQGSLTHGVMVDPEVEKNFQPECGWPEFCEKLWLLRHYLDYAKRFCDGKPS